MIGDDTFAYRRRLPHLCKDHKTYFVTWVSKDRQVLATTARDIALRSCRHGHQLKYWLHCVVVMPDHVHVLISPFEDVLLATVIGEMKSASAHLINRTLQRSGAVWQAESFDRILRSDEKIVTTAAYILQNPVRRGLVADALDWPWFWSAFV
ncbi:MAG TPA: transposase [Thermoanaerobaculia bacterium]|nr:transposase [Thermoanaerobaculia bacterium]